MAIFDDVRSGDKGANFNFLLRALDKNAPARLEVKGSAVWFNPAIIILTCPRRPEEEFVWHDKQTHVDTTFEDIAQLQRRINCTVRFWIAPDMTRGFTTENPNLPQFNDTFINYQ